METNGHDNLLHFELIRDDKTTREGCLVKRKFTFVRTFHNDIRQVEHVTLSVPKEDKKWGHL